MSKPHDCTAEERRLAENLGYPEQPQAPQQPTGTEEDE